MKIKKILSVILAAVMLLGCMSITAFAASPESDFTFDAATGMITKYEGAGGDVVIPATIGGVDVTAIGAYAFCNSVSSRITSVTFPSTLLLIGDGAFDGCNNMTLPTLPENLECIGGFALPGGRSYVSYDIPASVISLGYTTFGYHTSLSSITLHWTDNIMTYNSGIFEEGDTSNATLHIPEGMTAAYAEKGWTTAAGFASIVDDVVIPSEEDPNFTIDANGVLTAYNGNGGNVVIPNGVTAIGDEAFRYNDTITSVVIPEGVTSIGEYAFYYCKNLTSVTIPSTVTTIGQYAFDDCESLTGVTIPEGVTSIGEGAFWSTGLTEVTIPASVTEIGLRAFYECSGLTSVTIPSSVTTIGSRAFADCSNLTDATLCWTNEDNIPTNDHAFDYIAGEATLHVPKGMTQVYADKGWGTSFYKGDDMNNIIDDVVVPTPTLSTFTLSKDYTDTYTADTKSTKVSEIINFTIAPVDGAPAFANSGAVTMTVTSGVGSAEVTLPTTFSAAGDFWYTITETAGTTAGVTYNTTPCYLHLVVYKIDGAYKVVSAAIHEAAPVNGEYSENDKIDTVTNSYAEGTLVIKQEATIDGTDNDDVFTEEVTFTIPEGTTIIGNITYTDSEGEHTITPDDWTDGTVTVEVKIKGGETVTFEGIPDGTTYEVTQTDSNPELGYGDPDYTVENGETDEDVVVTVSDKETKVTGTISDGEDDITIKNESTTPIDVGVILENGAFIILALGAIALGVWLVIAKRKNRESVDAE